MKNLVTLLVGVFTVGVCAGLLVAALSPKSLKRHLPDVHDSRLVGTWTALLDGPAAPATKFKFEPNGYGERTRKGSTTFFEWSADPNMLSIQYLNVDFWPFRRCAYTVSSNASEVIIPDGNDGPHSYMPTRLRKVSDPQ